MKKIFKRISIPTLLGSLFILTGILFNQWMLGFLFGSVGTPIINIIIWVFDLVMVCLGMLIFLQIIRIKELILIFCSIFIALLLGETILRLLDKTSTQNGSMTIRGGIIASREFHHEYKPSQVLIRYPERYDEFGNIENIINSQGVRGPEIPIKKGKKKGILLLGDSFIQADEIEWEKTVGKQLEKKLSGSDYSVVQYGMASWSPLLYLNWLNKRGLEFELDTVILFLCVNDFFGEYYDTADPSYTKKAVFDSDGFPRYFNIAKPTTEALKPIRSVKNSLMKTMWITKFLEIDLHQIYVNTFKSSSLKDKDIRLLLNIDKDSLKAKLNEYIPPWYKCSRHIEDTIRLTRPIEKWDAETEKNVALSLSYLYRTKCLLEKEGVSLAITLVPLGWNINKKENLLGRKAYCFSDCVIPMGGIYNKIKTFCRKNDLRLINLHAPFIEYISNHPEDRLFLINDVHFSNTGHKLTADIIYKSLFEN